MNPNQPQDEPVLFGAGMGHMVIVDGIDDTGYVLIHDPWEGTRYKMRKDDFLKHSHSSWSLPECIMNVKVLAIEPTQALRTFNITVLIGEDKYQFTMKVEIDQIANQEIQIIKSDEHFLKTFQFHQKLAADISQLVFNTYNNQSVNLPVELGKFYIQELKVATTQ